MVDPILSGSRIWRKGAASCVPKSVTLHANVVNEEQSSISSNESEGVHVDYEDSPFELENEDYSVSGSLRLSAASISCGIETGNGVLEAEGKAVGDRPVLAYFVAVQGSSSVDLKGAMPPAIRTMTFSRLPEHECYDQVCMFPVHLNVLTPRYGPSFVSAEGVRSDINDSPLQSVVLLL